MYKALIRRQIRSQIAELNRGNFEPLRRTVADDAELAFPGNNSWAGQFRAPRTGRASHTTHRGIAELVAFAERFVAAGLQIDVDDIVINGGPWNTRIVARATDVARDDDGNVLYENRVAIFIEARWGKIRRWEDYLDTEQVAAWDRALGIAREPATA